WLALEITVVSEASEAIEFALNELDALGTEINNLGKKQTETLCVIGYFNKKPNEKNLQNYLTEALRIYGFPGDAIKNSEWREVENTDWLAEWKKHWKPTVTEKFIIVPTWEKVENSDKIVIWIEPNMAFGTGTHETTRLCLQAIGEHFQSGMSFFDVGTGTGILAIAAKMQSKVQSPKSKVQDELTLDSIWACDTDENSIEIAKENAELNGVAGINFFVGSISEETPKFDFVCANLTADVILPLLPLLVQKSRKILVLSGILKEQENLITEKLRELQIANFKVQTDGEWISISARISN
ncbi:MAG: 50S ribosomal protein L11 methyltransferase, partial [Pyrinomonadaceae bacterium]